MVTWLQQSSSEYGMDIKHTDNIDGKTIFWSLFLLAQYNIGCCLVE